MIKTTINNKYTLYLPEHRALRPEWETGWEVERIEDMLSNLSKGDLVIDIGTEEGDISALLAQKTENIILFEPNAKVWPNIKAIWEANNLGIPEKFFVGFASNTNRINATPANIDGWPVCAYGELIGDHGFKELSDPGQIPQVKLDSFIMPRGPKLITIDVEGSEFEVLKGAEQTIRKYKPLIYVSVHPEFLFRIYGQYTAELCKFVTDLGYKYEVLAFDHEFHFKFTPI